jgi:hypothetical protein
MPAETREERQQRAVQRVLDSLDHLDARIDSHYARERRHARRPFRAPVSVCVPNPSEPIVRPDDRNSFRAWGRSLSEAGISLLHTEPIDAPLILVGIDLPGGGRKWFQSEIVRRRPIATEGFHEFGLVFRGRA